MARRVTGSKKDSDGDITGLCGVGWSHSKDSVVQNIRFGFDSYYVLVDGRQVDVEAKPRGGNFYLTTAADGYKPNNLDDLPNC